MNGNSTLEVSDFLRRNYEQLSEDFEASFGYEHAQLPHEVQVILSFVGSAAADESGLIHCPNVLAWVLLDDSLQVSCLYDLTIDYPHKDFIAFDVANIRVLDLPIQMVVSHG